MTAMPNADAIRKVPVAGPSISDLEVRYVTEAARSAWYGGAGSFISRFEESFRIHTGREHSFALPSCTSAIHLALAAANIGPGDEVIVPDLTWIGSSAAISYVGATPVFADVDADTWCITLDAIKAVTSPQTRAVIAVNLYGGMPDYTQIEAWAKEHNIFLIEDAAESIGSTIDGRPAGSWGDVSTFSFHGSKTMTTGEGGMLLCNDEKLAERVGILRDHGRLPGDQLFFNSEIGFKYKMTDLQAALGLAQIERIDELVSMKRSIFRSYEKRLESYHQLTLNAEPPNVKNSYWMTTVILDDTIPISKLELYEFLRTHGVASRPFFHPLSSLPAYAGANDAIRASSENTVSYAIGGRGVNLPSALSLTDDDINHVTSTLTKAIGVTNAR
jgi:perosamine synthetase